MQLAEYGSPEGRLVVYFHGAPGAVQECAVFDEMAKRSNLRFVCFDRFALEEHVSIGDYYLAIAEGIKEQAGDKSIDIVAFSIGCHVAIQVNALLGDQVRCLHLISAAAPLESGDYLDDMAGSVVFKLAKSNSMAFAALSRWQSLLCRLSARILYSMIFGSAKAQDKTLSQNEQFRASVYQILRHSYVQQLAGYKRDVEAYVQPWSSVLGSCNAQVQLWHGKEDNWSPVAMSESIRNALPSGADVHLIEDASHYSCLHESAEAVCLSLQKD